MVITFVKWLTGYEKAPPEFVECAECLRLHRLKVKTQLAAEASMTLGLQKVEV